MLWTLPIHETVDVERPANPDTYPEIDAGGGKVGAIATGVGGLVMGGLIGAGYAASKNLSPPPSEEATSAEGED